MVQIVRSDFMDLRKYFRYESSVISEEVVIQLSEDDLDTIYADGNSVDRFNAYFHLENELLYLMEQKNYSAAAHVCYLISYYLFTALTPPHSDTLALAYANKALELSPTDKYQNWLKEVKRGN